MRFANCKSNSFLSMFILKIFSRATTHTDLVVRARECGIKVEVVHNASIMNAAGCCGLQLYRFGQTISQVFWTDTWQPDSYYDKIKVNRAAELHTLCLLGTFTMNLFI